jgi:hypothetical protein
MVCQNLELQEGFNFLLRCILEIRLTLTNEGLHPPHSQIPRLFPSYTLTSDSCPVIGMLTSVKMVKIQCHLRRGYSLGSTPRLYGYNLLGYNAVQSVESQQTTRRFITEDSTLHNHRCGENLKSYKMFLFVLYWRCSLYVVRHHLYDSPRIIWWWPIWAETCCELMSKIYLFVWRQPPPPPKIFIHTVDTCISTWKYLSMDNAWEQNNIHTGIHKSSPVICTHFM